MIYNDGEPVHGANETYLENEWHLPHNEQHKVREAMKFKHDLGEKLPGKEDDILLIYSDTLKTFATIGYSSTGITVDKEKLHFSSPYKHKGDTVVVTESAIGSMSSLYTYKKTSIPDVTHTELPNNGKAIEGIKNFLNL